MRFKFIGCPWVSEKQLPTRAYIAVFNTRPVKAWNKKGEVVGEYSALNWECVTYSELEEFEHLMMTELQKVKKEAKEFFQKEKERKLSLKK